MLSFEIKQREGGFYSARTDRRTEPPNSALVYRYIYWYVVYVSYCMFNFIDKLYEVILNNIRQICFV